MYDYNHLMIGLWAYSNNLPLALRPITHISNVEWLSVTIMLLLCQRLRQGICNIVIGVYFAYFHISSINDLSNEMEASKNVFISLMRYGFICLRNGSIVVTIELLGTTSNFDMNFLIQTTSSAASLAAIYSASVVESATMYQRARPRVDDNLNNIKINIPPFHGKTDPEAYLAWEKKIEHIFECHNYSELKKVKLAAIEFVDYALIWWDQLTSSRRRNGERHISTWNEMKAIMRRRFIPTHYHRELFNKLQNLKQSNRSVEDYYKEMEVAMIRANIDEDREATMARFLAGLDPDIANVVELQHYIDIDDMVHMAMKVEKQLKRKGAARPYASNTSKWGHGSNKKNVAIPTKDGSGSSKPNKPIIESNKGKNTSTPVRSRDVQCFKCLGRGHIASQCPNRNAMFIRENGEIESDHEEEEETEVPIDEEEMEFAVDGEALVVKRSLSTQVMESEQQRENIFHTRCHVNGKVCFVIIDGGSCTNVASNLMIEKLGLPTTKHPQPYKLQWLNDGGEIKVTKQARIPFSIGKYKDEILCDVVPMHAGHLLLGRPWQFDRRAIHDGFTNRYSFAYEGKKITLAPLTPRQVHEDQIHLRKSIEKAKESEKDRVEKSKEGHISFERDMPCLMGKNPLLDSSKLNRFSTLPIYVL
ncbi:hypothetical protein GQ457_02G024220 [Hibiscus cannabinus]